MPGVDIQQVFPLALQHHQAGRLREAERIYRRILAQQPDHAESLHFLGLIAHQVGENQSALELIRKAIARKPDYTEAHNNLGSVLKAMGQPDEAIAAFRQALALKPDFPEGYNNLGILLRSKGQLDEAIAAYRHALVLDPNHFEATNNLAIALTETGEIDQSIAACRQAIARNPNPENSQAFTNLLLALHHHPDADARRILEETRQWARQQPVFTPDYSPRRDRNPDRKLKIGYVSPFFVMFADAHFIFPLLARHDHRQFEIFAYSRSSPPDDLTERLRAHCDHWIDIRQLGIQETVELMRGHELDIVVSISSPADKCLTILASRVAPIQMIWLVFASCTSGLATMDYRISDPYVDPPGMDETCYAEATVRLLETAWCYDPLVDSPSLPVNALPALSNGVVTFGSLNRSNKINPAVVAAWAQILHTVPNSRLHILAVAGSARQRLLD